MQLCIPKLGSKLRLIEPWTFKLHHEERNSTLHDLLGVAFDPKASSRWSSKRPEPTTVTLNAGNVLVIDRYYIRNGMKDFDSITFKLDKVSAMATNAWRSEGRKTRVRFWVQLEDCNSIKFEPVEE